MWNQLFSFDKTELITVLEMLATSFIGKINNRVDYVLVSTLPLTGVGSEDQELTNKKSARSVFLRNLRQEGLRVKTVHQKETGLMFDIITAPQRVLDR